MESKYRAPAGSAPSGKLRGFSEIKRSEEVLAKENKELHTSLLDLMQKHEGAKTESEKAISTLEAKVFFFFLLFFDDLICSSTYPLL